MSAPITTVAAVHVPGDDDVLMGRGKRSYHHEGNMRFRALVAERAKLYYETQSKRSRREIAKKIMKQIESKGGRFLQSARVNDWEATPEHVVITKVKQALRDAASVMFGSEKQPKARSVNISDSDSSNTEIRRHKQSGTSGSSKAAGRNLNLHTSTAIPEQPVERSSLTTNNGGSTGMLPLLQQQQQQQQQGIINSIGLQSLAGQNAMAQPLLMDPQTSQLFALLSSQQPPKPQFAPHASVVGQVPQVQLAAPIAVLPNTFQQQTIPVQNTMAHAGVVNNSNTQNTVQSNDQLLRVLNNLGALLTSQPQQAAPVMQQPMQTNEGLLRFLNSQGASPISSLPQQQQQPVVSQNQTNEELLRLLNGQATPIITSPPQHNVTMPNPPSAGPTNGEELLRLLNSLGGSAPQLAPSASSPPQQQSISQQSQPLQVTEQLLRLLNSQSAAIRTAPPAPQQHNSVPNNTNVVPIMMQAVAPSLMHGTAQTVVPSTQNNATISTLQQQQANPPNQAIAVQEQLLRSLLLQQQQQQGSAPTTNHGATVSPFTVHHFPSASTSAKGSSDDNFSDDSDDCNNMNRVACQS